MLWNAPNPRSGRVIHIGGWFAVIRRYEPPWSPQRNTSRGFRYKTPAADHSCRPKFPTSTCRQEQFIMVLGGNWCSRSTWVQHTVVYPIGKNLIKTLCSNRSPCCNHSVLDPGQVPEIKGVTRSAVVNSHRLLILLMGVDSPLMNISLAHPKYPPWSTTIGAGKLEQWVRKLWKMASVKLLKMRAGWKLNGNLPIVSIQITKFHIYHFQGSNYTLDRELVLVEVLVMIYPHFHLTRR